MAQTKGCMTRRLTAKVLAHIDVHPRLLPERAVVLEREGNGIGAGDEGRLCHCDDHVLKANCVREQSDENKHQTSGFRGILARPRCAQAIRIDLK